MIIPMANEQNLIPLNKRGKEEAKRIRQKGQAAQKEQQRIKKTMRQCADILLSLEVKDKRKLNKLTRAGVSEDDCDNKMLIVFGLMQAAQVGDVMAAKELRSIIGEDKALESETGHAEAMSDLTKAIKEAAKNED